MTKTTSPMIFLTGGGSGGPVMPLVALMQELRHLRSDLRFLYIGTSTGPERELIEAVRQPFVSIPAAKWRRYWSWQILLDPFRLAFGLVRSLWLIARYRPQAVVSAGGYVSVPVAYVAALFRIPVFIHQLDVDVGLANALMVRVARTITVSYAVSAPAFPTHKTVVIGTPVRREVVSGTPQSGRDFFGIPGDERVLLVLGGGTGAQRINDLIHSHAADFLALGHIIHVTGRGKAITINSDRYHGYELLTTEMAEALAAADVVISRAGAATLGELSVMGKATVLLPIANNQQENNARLFYKNNAAMVLVDQNLTAATLVEAIQRLLSEAPMRENLQRNMKKMNQPDAASRWARIVADQSRILN